MSSCFCAYYPLLSQVWWQWSNWPDLAHSYPVKWLIRSNTVTCDGVRISLMFTDCIFCAQYEETNEDVAFVYAYLRHTIRRWRVEYDEFTSVLMDESKYCWLDPSGCGSYRNPFDLIYQDELPDLSSDELCPEPKYVPILLFVMSTPTDSISSVESKYVPIQLCPSPRKVCSHLLVWLVEGTVLS